MNSLFSAVWQFLISTFLWTILALDTLLAFFVIGLLSPFDRHQQISYHMANLWGKIVVWANPFWKISVKGTHHIKKKKAYVLVANHASMADILYLYCLGRHFKWIAKESIFKVPFFGWTMSLMRYIPLKRGERGSIRESFQEARRWLERNVSVLIFPEGTRSRTGKIGEFKNGAFKLALRSKIPIIPIVISGTYEALSRGRAALTGTAVKGFVKVLPEVSVDSYTEDDYEAVKTKVWNLMNDELTGAGSTNSSRQNHQLQAV